MTKLVANFLARFREIFVPSHLSLEFRAKSFAVLIAAKKQIDPEIWQSLTEISKKVYPHDESRQMILVEACKEYVDRIKKNELSLDSLLKNIAFLLRKHPRYAKKIDFERLKLLIDENEEDSLVQLRVYEFFEQEVKYVLESMQKRNISIENNKK